MLTILLIVLAGLIYSRIDQLRPSPTILDSPTSFIGFNHIGISVLDLNKMVKFYQDATGFELVEQISIENNTIADQVFGIDSIAYQTAVLKGPNMLLELTQFENQTDTVINNMPVYGPGMTHTCYQTASENSGYNKFKSAGASMLSRGDEPIDLGGYGVTYAYGHDPEGNMLEMEQMSNTVIRLMIGKKYAEKNPMWMTQVALMSPELPKLIDFYEKVLAIEPYRVKSYAGIPTMDAIANMDSVELESGWFALDTQGKKMELMQFTSPIATPHKKKRRVTDLGYTFSFEVEDIEKEYQRMTEDGVEFISSPQPLKHFITAMAYDVDGNVFSIRQVIDPDSPYSLRSLTAND